MSGYADKNRLHADVAMPKQAVKDGSRRNWIDDVVDPEDAYQHLEVDADNFYDYFLSIPLIKSVRRFKDQKQEWYEKLEVIAAGIPDGLKWVETKKPSEGTGIQNEALAKALTTGMKTEVEITKKDWDSFQEADLIHLSSHSYIKAGPGMRYFKPAVADHYQKSQDLKNDIANIGGQEAVKEIVACAVHYKRYSDADSLVKVLEMQKNFRCFCGQFDEVMPKYIPKRKVESSNPTEATTHQEFWPGTNVPVVLASFFPVTISSLSNNPDNLGKKTHPLTLGCGDQIPFRKRNTCSKNSPLREISRRVQMASRNG